jgi:3-oxoacyl-[acyl-carrier protein] reductase
VPGARKVALVTGASRGIGRTVALALADDGFDLALCARSAEDLRIMQRALIESESFRISHSAPGESTGNLDVAIYPLDVRDGDAVSAMVASAVERFGRIDLLFNNAGIFREGTSELVRSDLTEMLDINLKAAVHFMQVVVPVMKKQGSGHIMNVSSRSGKLAKPGSGGYAASKFGLVGFNEALYREVSGFGIRVTALCPGWVDTDMARFPGLEAEDKLTTEDIVKTVRWLLSLSPAACVKEVYMESIKQVE